MKRAQTFTTDFILALVVVTIIAVIMFAMILSKPGVSRAQLDAQALAGIVYNPYPENWDSLPPEDLVLPGFVINQRYNDTLFTAFETLNPETVRSLVGIESFYEITVYDDGLSIGTAGDEPGDDGYESPDDVDEVHVVRRYAAYQGDIVTIEVVAWQ